MEKKKFRYDSKEKYLEEITKMIKKNKMNVEKYDELLEEYLAFEQEREKE